jgi:glycosyltransferase involved in cell wall biosynthesis
VPDPSPPFAVLLKGYPRISETFIARELLGLQERGLRFTIVSLRRPTDRITHDLHERIEAPVLYLPEYLKVDPRRVARALHICITRRRFRPALRAWLRDLLRDPTANRGRRFGQALVLAAELPPDHRWLHAHFMHTPGSVARYAALLTGLPFSLSAHAKDIWTIPAREKRQKLEDAAWTVTCTQLNARHLRELAPGADIELLYHGVDAERFRPAARGAGARDGSVTTASVARCVPKKGMRTLLEALGRLRDEPNWRHVHIGSGPLLGELQARAQALGIADRIRWLGTLSQLEVLEVLQTAELFCLAPRIAEDGDRDGLPNVLMEAMSVGLPVVTTAVSAIPELVEHRRNGLLVPPDDPDRLAAAIRELLADDLGRQRMGLQARVTVVERFGAEAGLDRLARRFGAASRSARAA